MNVFQAIKRETQSVRAKTALIEGGSALSYGELLSFAEELAADLKKKGVMPFHRVGLLCDDSIDYIIASLAILSLSAAVVPVSPEQKEEEVEAVIERIDVDFLIAGTGLRRVGYGDPLRSSGLFKKQFVIAKRAVRERPTAEYFRISPAFIRFSSGTTGMSKGVVLSHETILARTDAADRGLRITSDDVVLWVLSMSFHFVVTILLFLRRGATIVLCGHRFPESLIEGITKHEGTFIYASPFHYSILSRADALAGDALKNVRMAVSTAMKLPVAVAEEFQAKFGFELTEAYGIIEVGLPFMNLAGDRMKRGSVGKPLPDYELSLRNTDASGVGEIWLKGKGMLDAYFSPWGARAGILKDGWFKTGDLGKVDAEGYLFIMGRDKGVINFAGMKVFAEEVEAVINQHPRVRESLVFGVSHAQYGQLPVAKVVLTNGTADLAELRRFCYERLSPYKVPKDFEFVSELPKTASGKIRR